MRRLQDIIYIMVLSLPLWIPSDGNPLHHLQQISRDHAITTARLLNKELPRIYRNLLDHLGLEGDNQPSICLPVSERSNLHWYRYSDAAGSRLCLYRKCLRRLERTLATKYSFTLNNTPQGLNNLVHSIFKMKAQDFSCGEAEAPSLVFWESVVTGGAYVIRDLINDLGKLVRESDSLTIDYAHHRS